MDGSVWRGVSLVSVLLGIVSFAFPSPVLGQVLDDGPTSIGLSAPDSTQPVRAYRLPTWRWSRWRLGGDGRANWESFERGQSDKSDRWIGLDLFPSYRAFWEGEERLASLSVAPRLSLSGERSQSSDPEGERDRRSTDAFFSLNTGGDLREYVGDRFFLLADGDGRASYSWRRTEEMDPPTTTDVGTRIRADLRLGVGWGRVRVVTPVIRALRVRERLRAVAPGATLSDEQVQAAARQLARRPGYGAVYDRPDKSFWRDFFDRAGLAERSAFETFYVADVLREPVGVRLEGAEVQIGPTGSYEYDLDRAERDGRLDERTQMKKGALGGFVRGRWARNMTLNHQLGGTADLEYLHFVDSQGPLDHEVNAFLEGQWLWVIADRVRLDTRLRAHLRYRDALAGEIPTDQGGFRPFNRYTASSALRVFVENSLSLTLGAELRYRYDGLGEVRRWRYRFDERAGSPADEAFDAALRFSVDYILSRALE
jgi:hypothetical protein